MEDTYNVNKVGEHEKNTFTHYPHNPQLWLETGATNEPDRNHVYGMPIISTRDIRADYNVTTLGIQYNVIIFCVLTIFVLLKST